ncbi:MAG: hypothetical protein RLZZ324_1122 [Candidatus Parcubacteria bacterium]
MFKSTYDALKEVHLLRKKFEKSEKYSLGETLERAMLDILLHIIRAGSAKQEWKIAAIDDALGKLEESKILVRLAHDLKQISEKQYLGLAEQTQKIGRMLGGWRKAT